MRGRLTRIIADYPVWRNRPAHAPTHYPGYEEEKIVYEKTIDRANATLDSKAPRIASNDRYVVAQWDKLAAKQEEVSREIRAYQTKHKAAWVPMQVFNEIEDRLARKYGLPTFAEKMSRK